MKQAVLYLFIIFLISNSASAQNVKDQLLRGDFENISVAENPAHLAIAYENRKYRFEARGLASVLKIAGAYAAEREIDSLSVLVRHNGLPIVNLKTPVDPLNAMIDGDLDYSSWSSTATISLDTDAAEQRLADEKISDPVRFQPVFPVGLGMRYQLGNYNNPYRFAFDLEPGIRVPLGKGWAVSSSIAIPLYNDFDENTAVRPIRATLTKEASLEDEVFGGISAGLFGRNRVGVHGALKAFLYEEVLSLTIQGGYTTFTDLSGSVPRLDIEDQNFAVYTATAAYRWKPYDLDLSAEYGQFLYRDYGVRLEAERHFGEVQIGFFANITKFGENAGFHFSIPLFPSTYRNQGAVRIRPAERFPVTYRYRGNDYDARMYETGITFEDEVAELYPSFLLKEMKPFLLERGNKDL